MTVPPLTDFEHELRALINHHSQENASDTPDYILARYLNECLRAFAAASAERDRWYGFRTLGTPITVATPER